MPFLSPFLRELAYAVSVLPCAGCGAPGPHPTCASRADGIIALCAACRFAVESKGREDPGQDGEDVLHALTVSAEAAAA